MKLTVYAARFYHHVSLPLQQVGVLRMEVARRLRVDASVVYALVKDGDTLVEFDEDISDGLVLDVFLREVSFYPATFFHSSPFIHHPPPSFIIFHLSSFIYIFFVSETNVSLYFPLLPFLLPSSPLSPLLFLSPLPLFLPCSEQ